MSECPHLSLTKFNVGNVKFYECYECLQKFSIELTPFEITVSYPQSWRVGTKVPLNVYEGDRPLFQAHTPEEALRLVGLLNDASRLRAEVESLKRYLLTLATSLYQKHYRTEAPNWKPLEDAMGLLMQVDNMVTGIAQENDSLRKQIAEQSDTKRLDLAEKHLLHIQYLRDIAGNRVEVAFNRSEVPVYDIKRDYGSTLREALDAIDRAMEKAE